MTRFLFLSARPEVEALGPEFAAMQRACGLAGDEFVLHRLDEAPLDPGVLDEFTGVVTGGSPFNVTTPQAEKSSVQLRVESDLRRAAEWALDGSHPAFFTCYGIGVLTELLGGTVDTEHGEDAGAVVVSLTAAAASDPLTAGFPAEFNALVGHHESTGRLPAGATLLGSSAGCPVQLYRIGSVVATQFHPEVTTQEFADRSRVYRAHGYFPESEYELVVERMRRASVTEPQKLLGRFVDLARR
ncbi:MAG TPA: GMP synthase [Candidatus Lumbricidophila sp.]|nr:GMP synthase [Candidatus Lumbricidophila sp.]